MLSSYSRSFLQRRGCTLGDGVVAKLRNPDRSVLSRSPTSVIVVVSCQFRSADMTSVVSYWCSKNASSCCIPSVSCGFLRMYLYMLYPVSHLFCSISHSIVFLLTTRSTLFLEHHRPHRLARPSHNHDPLRSRKKLDKMPEMQYLPNDSASYSDSDSDKGEVGETSCLAGCNGPWATDVVGSCLVATWALIATACSGCSCNGLNC